MSVAKKGKKFCPGCKKTKKLAGFYKNLSQKDGLQIYCVECQSKYSIDYYYKNKSTKITNKIQGAIK